MRRRARPWLLGGVSAAAAPACCVVSGSRVRTPDGQVPIDRLAVGDSVLSFDIERDTFVPTRISAIRSAMRSCLSLRSGASTLVCTPDHPVYMPDSATYEHAAHAVPGRALVHPKGRGASSVAVDVVGTPSGLHRVIDITVDSALHNFVAEDVLVHNKDFADCTAADAFPEVITLDEANPMQRVVVRVCREGRDLTDGFLEAWLDVRTASEGVDVARVAVYFDAGERIEVVDGLAPFGDFISTGALGTSCSEGIPLVLERLDSELSIPATVSLAIDAEECHGNLAEELTVDVEVAS